MTILLQGAGIQAVASGPTEPQFGSAEIGAVNAFTLVVTFDQDVSASDYSTGVTIKVNGTATSITSATRQSNHAIVRYVIPVLWHGSGDAVTWEYNSATGNIVAESGGLALGDVAAQSVTNNAEYTALLDLQADALVLNDSDLVSTWTDQSGQGHDFTQSGAARPVYRSSGGARIVFNGTTQFMRGQNWSDLDGMTGFSILAVVQPVGIINGMRTNLICKIGQPENDDPGWTAMLSADGTGVYTDFFIYTDSGNYSEQVEAGYLTGNKQIATYEMKSVNEMHLYTNGTIDDLVVPSTTGASVYTTTQVVRLAVDGSEGQGGAAPFAGNIYAILVCVSSPSSANRAALETRLGARYGLTVP